jgi:AmiR/NasT family two-component response regulator
MKTSIITNRTILLVDDDRLVLTTIARGLTELGYNVLTAESVDDAEAILASGERPDLTILDISMPGKSGLELAERLHLFDHIPFMLLTAYSDPALVEQAAKCGALGYLVKPVDISQLVPTIEAALARANELRSLKMLGQHLQNALNNDQDISAAIGITMVKDGLTRKVALESLRNTARSRRCKLADLAKEMINENDASNSHSLVS